MKEQKIVISEFNWASESSINELLKRGWLIKEVINNDSHNKILFVLEREITDEKV
jgi:D-aminopeptidase